MKTDTIVAQSTPQGPGAISMIRLSGESVFEVVSSFARLASGSSIIDVPTHTIHYGSIVSSEGVLIDQVVFLVMRAPRSFTGENTIEITCHNNPFIIQAVIQQAVMAGARPALAGEFTQRAVMKGKIDLLQAESIHELITANTEFMLKKALAQVQGSFSSWVVQVEHKLLNALAYAQASFEFIEEEGIEFKEQIGQILLDCLHSIDLACSQFNVQEQVRSGIRVTLVGSVNAGKSSLFNALIGKDRAIVTPIAGTTRDSLEAGVYRNGIYITFIDTAGLRETNDVIEQLGIEQSYKSAALSDVLLLVFDGSRQASLQEKYIYQDLITKYASKIILVRNKIDIPDQKENNSFSVQEEVSVSSAFGTHVDQLCKKIEAKIELLTKNSDLPFVLNSRQYALFIDIGKKLRNMQELMQKQCHYEILAHHLVEVIACIADLTGKSISEESMDRVFREFCVGK